MSTVTCSIRSLRKLRLPLHFLQVFICRHLQHINFLNQNKRSADGHVTITWLVHSVRHLVLWCFSESEIKVHERENNAVSPLLFTKRYLTVVIVYWSNLQRLFVSLTDYGSPHEVRWSGGQTVNVFPCVLLVCCLRLIV